MYQFVFILIIFLKMVNYCICFLDNPEDICYDICDNYENLFFECFDYCINN